MNTNNTATREPAHPVNRLNRLVHEPSRLLILSCLHGLQSADFLFLLRQTGLTRGNLSSHMSKLEGAGLVQVEKSFVDKIPRTLYRITDDGRNALRTYRAQMEDVLADLPE
ncbi:MAG: helix-turn-helix domain-containing protein [Candidatus Latescibacteria bacterium]|nr:helix-turn-helix domain-containing protein [Candidatus Latescibacterota bacterium]